MSLRIDIDGCIEKPCGVNATCTDFKAPSTGRTCQCPQGYSGDEEVLCQGNPRSLLFCLDILAFVLVFGDHYCYIFLV